MYIIEIYAIIHKHINQSLHIMYDDYDIDFSYTGEYGDLDTYDNLDLEEDYERDSNDYQDLAYKHYA